MSLETLLEAAEFLERNHNFKTENGNQLTQPVEVSSIGGHLKIDPNLPISSISLQFHTYSSSVPTSTTNSELHLLSNTRGKLNRSGCVSGRTKSASFSVSNSTFQQSRATIRRNRNLTYSDKSIISEATSRHRELHKTLEKNRRAHLRSCFNELMNELPKTEYTEKKYSHINIIHYAIRYIHQLKKTEHDRKEELNKLNRLKNEYESSLMLMKQQLIDELNQSNVSGPSNSTNQSNDSSLENSENDSNSDKRIFSVRSQKEIDELLSQVEQSLLCASENGSAQFSNCSQLDIISDDYDDETTCSASEADEQKEDIEYSVTNSSIRNQIHV